MDKFLAIIRNYIKSLPKSKLYLYLGIVVAILGGSVIGLSFLQKEEYQPLFVGLTTDDASMVVTKLKEQKVPYQLGANGTTISVPKEKVADVRLLLASQNSLPGSGGVGLELFDKTNYGMTEFMQNVNYKRAIQGELTRTINQMPGIVASRIHIAIPEKTLFTDKEQEATASIFLKLKQGTLLSKEQVLGIVNLVAGSVEGLKPDSVVVIDSSGRILHKSGDGDAGMMLSGQQYELQRNVERTIEESVQSMLDTFLQNSKSIVRASVDLNLRKVEKMEEQYLPDKTAVSAEKKSKEKTMSTRARVGGVPGVPANLAATTAAKAAAKNGNQAAARPEDQNTNQSEKEESNVNYEVSKTVSKIVEPFGDIKRISLAVLVDGKYERVKTKKGEELKYIPRSQQELDNIKNLVLRAAGFNEERGDKIEVINMPFEVETTPEERGLLGNSENKQLAVSLGKYLFYLVVVLCVFLFFLRPLFRMFQKKDAPEAALPLQEVKDVYIKANDQPGAAALPNVEKPPSALAEALKDRALVRSVIREWVRENP
jgi:flagellar M-ring protein FliF